MSKYRNLDTGDVLPASWTDAIQEFISTVAANAKLTLQSATTVQIVAAANSGQVSIGIDGLWRYRTTTATAIPSGSAGTRDIYVTATANAFGGGDSDTTDYNFALAIPAAGTPGGVAAYRKIGELQWDGAKVTELRQTVGYEDATLPSSPTTPHAAVTPLMVRGIAGQTAALLTAGTTVTSPSDRLSLSYAGLLSVPAAGGGITTAGTFNADGAATLGGTLNVTGTSTLGTAAVTTFSGTPNFSGAATGQTAAVDTNTTQLATTAFVVGQAAGASPLMDGSVAVGTSTRFARADHIHPIDTSRAPLASPTLTGTPAAPTAAVDTNTTQIATTAFVVAQAGGSNPVMDGAATVGTSLRYSRQDHVHPTDTSRAPLASPTFTGTPAAPTAADGTNTTQLASTQFVMTAVANATNNGATTTASNIFSNLQTFQRAATTDPALQARTGAEANPRFLVLAGGDVQFGPGGATAVGDVQVTRTGVGVLSVTNSGGTAGTLNARTGIQINGTALAASHLSNGTTGTGSVVLAAAPTLTGTTTLATAAVTTLSGTPNFSGAATGQTAAADTNTTQLATTAFVIGQGYAKLASPTLTGTPLAPTAAVDTNTTQIATTAYVVGQGYLKTATAASTYAPLASPTFTGTPAAPTAGAGTSTTQLATTAFVTTADNLKANLASPTFTGTPLSTTAAVDTNTTQIATTAYVVGQGYLKSATAASTYAPLTSPTFTTSVTTPILSTTGNGNWRSAEGGLNLRGLAASYNTGIVFDASGSNAAAHLKFDMSTAALVFSSRSAAGSFAATDEILLMGSATLGIRMGVGTPKASQHDLIQFWNSTDAAQDFAFYRPGSTRDLAVYGTTLGSHVTFLQASGFRIDTNVGFYGTTPVARDTGWGTWTPTSNLTGGNLRVLDDTSSLQQTKRVVGTLMLALRTNGLLGA